MPSGIEEAAAGAAAAGIAANSLNQIIQFVRVGLLVTFTVVSINYLLTTPVFFDAVANKIVGYPECKGYIGSLQFCFAPSADEYNNVLVPTYSGLASGFSGNIFALFTAVFSINFLASLAIVFKLITLLNAFFFVFFALLNYNRWWSSAAASY